MANNDYRNESRRRPPAEKYGTPGTQYPTANPYDLVITEEVTHRAQAFEPVLYGTPHPTVAAAVLCYQGQIKGNNTDKAPVRIYATPRLAQEPYNLVNGAGEANDPDYPAYVRSYLLPRGSAKATIGDPLTALIGLTLVSGGAGYGAALETPGYGKIALGFSGGAGSGAAGFAEVAGGVIVAVVLTHTGSGYTGDPAVSVSGGSGAGITALRQPSTALLTKEEEQPAEEPFGGAFVRVTRTWETIPGPTLRSSKYDAESDAIIASAKTRKLMSAITEGVTKIEVGGDTFVQIVESEQIDALTGYEVVTTIPEPAAHDEESALLAEESRPFQFPATVNIAYYAATAGLLGYTKSFVRKVPHIIKTWWVIDTEKPALTLNGLPKLGALTGPVAELFGEIIYDAVTLPFGVISLDYPGSDPNLTEYLATWVGGSPPTPRSVMGSVTRDGNKYRWKVEKIYVQFVIPAQPTVHVP
jgi:hypothetical protein